jgi:arabinose-5-phosphate isomerase
MTSLNTMAQVLRLEAKALEEAANRLEKNHIDQVHALSKVYSELLQSDGTLIFCGVGKSGIIAQKLASTFCSLGLPSFFLHPVEALHGDLGRVRKNDAIVFLSKSGTTEEILKLIPFLSIPKERTLALLGNTQSAIANFCEIVLDCSVEKEACINNQAPTTSSTLALAMGDAMAVLYEAQVGLSKEGFAINHPGGILGKSLRMKVRDLMIDSTNCAIVKSSDKLKDVILVMTKFPVSGCAVVDDGKFIGILVEGDIRRTFTKENQGLETSVSLIVNKSPIQITPDSMAYEALEKMESKTRSIQILPVVEENKFLGFIRLHELLKEGFSLKS